MPFGMNANAKTDASSPMPDNVRRTFVSTTQKLNEVCYAC